MKGVKLLAILLCCIGVVVSSAPRDVECRRHRQCNRYRGEKCAFFPATDNPIIDYTPCTEQSYFCVCKKVCRWKKRYVVQYHNGCDWCYCVDSVRNRFWCARRNCSS